MHPRSSRRGFRAETADEKRAAGLIRRVAVSQTNTLAAPAVCFREIMEHISEGVSSTVLFIYFFNSMTQTRESGGEQREGQNDRRGRCTVIVGQNADDGKKGAHERGRS